MRKIKITALILAVLMVMAAFAGCASKSTVEDLDERVTALEGKIDANQKANEEAIAGLLEAINGLKDTQANIQNSVDSNKSEQAASDKALQETLDKLLEKLEKVEKDQAAADAQDKADKEAAAQLQTYKATAAAKIATLEASYLANKADYAAADYVKIVEILANANISVEQAADKAAVDAAMKKLDTDLAAYTTVNQGLYNLYLELKGNIFAGAETKAKVEAAQAALTAAQKHYELTPEKLTKFAVGGYQADGKTPLTINLVDAVTVMCRVFNSTIDSYNDRLQIVEPNGTITTYATLAYVEARAKELVTSIELAGKLDMILANTNKLITLGDQYKAWLDFANLLSTKNAALVTNAAKLDEYVAAAKNLLAAQKAFGETLNFDAVTKTPASIFKAYNDLADKTLYTNYESVYAKIDAVLAAWKAEYNLTDKQVKDIVCTDYVYVNTYNVPVTVHTAFVLDEQNEVDEYQDYLDNRDLSKQYYDKYIVFSTEIAPKIKALNTKFVSIDNVDHIKEFRAIAEEIRAWAYTFKKDGSIDKELVNGINFNAMVTNIGLKTGYTYGLDTTAAQNVDFLGLYTFGQGAYTAEGVIVEFFENTYFSAKAVADALNAAIADASTASVLELITISGEYNVDGNKFWAKTEDELKALETVAADYFASTVTVAGIDLPVYEAPGAITAPLNVATFKRSSQEYDLAAVLVDTAALNAKKAEIEARVAELKPIAKDDIIPALNKLDATTTMIDLDSHEAKLNKAYDAYIANWMLDGAVVAYAEAVVGVEKRDILVNGQTINADVYVYTVTELLKADQIATLTACWAEVQDLRKQANALIDAYKVLADINAAKAITIESIAADTVWSTFSYAKSASKGEFYMEAVAAAAKNAEYLGLNAENTAKLIAAAAESGALFGKVTYRDLTNVDEDLANAAFLNALSDFALTYAEMIEYVSERYAAFTADNNTKTAKDVEAAKKDNKFADYELMAQKVIILKAVWTAIDGSSVSAEAKEGYYNNLAKGIVEATSVKNVISFLNNAERTVEWNAYDGATAITIAATTYAAGATLTGAITIG